MKKIKIVTFSRYFRNTFLLLLIPTLFIACNSGNDAAKQAKTNSDTIQTFPTLL